MKVRSIEALDRQVIGTILDGIGRYGDWRIMVLPDHATPVSTKTHSADPVPFAIMDSCSRRSGGRRYSEPEAAATGIVVTEAHRLLDRFVTGDF
jgi:2,3-bisphosphoglycerate-independent phosphoglycerate mutase